MGMGHEVPIEDRAAGALSQVIAGLNALGLPVAEKVRLLREWASDAGCALTLRDLAGVRVLSPPGQLPRGWRGMERVSGSTLAERTRIMQSEVVDFPTS